MAYNNKKLREVLQDQFEDVPERCEGYKEKLARLLVNVVNLERAHAIAKRSVVKDIANEVHAVGMSLHRSRSAPDE